MKKFFVFKKKHYSNFVLTSLILLTAILLFAFQNCSDANFQNPTISSSGIERTCVPTDKCLNVQLTMAATIDKKTSTACISSTDVPQNVTPQVQFGGSCTPIGNHCGACLLNIRQSVTIILPAQSSKENVDQSVTLRFTPDGTNQAL